MSEQAMYWLGVTGIYHHADCSYLHDGALSTAAEIAAESHGAYRRPCGHCRPQVAGVARPITAKERQRRRWAESPQGRIRAALGANLTKRELQMVLLVMEERQPGTLKLVYEELGNDGAIDVRE